MPEDDCYYPMYVGAMARELEKFSRPGRRYYTDGTGDNIAEKNPNYCELTGIYWAWKNLKADYIGLVHYRRHFTHRDMRLPEDRKGQVLTKSDWQAILQEADVVVPKKRRYYIETNYSHYIHAHHREGLDMAGEIIKKKYPRYALAYETVMGRTWAYMFNMFVMRKDCFNAYCEWLFDILFEVGKKLDFSSYNPYEARVFGFISEILLNVWLETNNLKYKEQNVSFMERQNWVAKGGKFVLRKIGLYR